MKTATLCHTLLALLLLPTAQRLAGAHAFLDRAEPKVGSEIKTPPTEIKIWFTKSVEATRSKIQVFDAAGNQIDKKDTHLDKNNKTLLIVTLPQNLAAGTYKVVWRAVAGDTHQTNGDFKFTLKTP